MVLPGLDAEVAAFTRSLWQRDVIYFPVRHHSPACARLLETLIAQQRPRAVLVEGPTSFEPLLPVLLDARTVPPVAFYSTFVDLRRRLGTPPEGQPDFGPARFAAYYPFAEYSPEWVALRAGAASGARLHFIDLDYAAQVVADPRHAHDSSVARAESLLDDRYLRRSRYLQALAVRTGCRDFDELWDHLFESRADRLTPADLIAELGTYCWMARRECTADELAADATLARERWMAACVRRVLVAPHAEGAGPVLVVTGGFHTAALPGMVAADQSAELPAVPDFGSDETQHFVIRYSFPQLDALNGYSAGMPSPHFYQKLWEGRGTPAEANCDAVAAGFLVDLGRQTRRRRLANPVSSADAIAALQQARLLARMRGHVGPSREDLLDGIRSCFGKGSAGDEAAVVMVLARELMAGQAVGELAPGAGVPPLVADFRRLAAELRLTVDDSGKRKHALALYRKVRHRRLSRLFHSLEFLNVPLARLLAGPDFVRGFDTGRLIEHWESAWTPRTESALVDAAALGATVDEATLTRLKQFVAQLAAEGRGRSASVAVEVLIRACRMGLHAHCAELVALIRTSLAEDSSFVSVVRAAEQFVLLWQAREPLEAHRLRELPELVQTALMRAAGLVPTLPTCPPEERETALRALVALRGLLAAVPERVDPDVFWNALVRLRLDPACEPLLAGAALGLLHSVGRADADLLAREGAGFLGAVGLPWERRIEFLRGLLTACREVAWQSSPVLRAVDGLLSGWSDEEFLRALPDLRLAFADLTPRETDQVGTAVGVLHGVGSLGDLFQRGVSAAELEAHRRLSLRVLQQLQEDGLVDWAGTAEAAR